MPPLKNLKREKFAQLMVKGVEREEAINLAGWKRKTWTEHRSTSSSMLATTLLKDKKVAARIEELQRQVANGLVAGRRKVLVELTRVALSDPLEMFDPQTGNLRAMKDIPKDLRRAISSVEVDELYEKDQRGKKRLIGYTRKIKLWNKVEALDKLAKYHKLYNETSANQNNLTQVNIYVPDNGRQRSAKDPNGATGHGPVLVLPDNGRQGEPANGHG